MEIMTPPSNGTRLKLRLRNAANSLLGRTKSRAKNTNCKTPRLVKGLKNGGHNNRTVVAAIEQPMAFACGGKFASQVHNAISSRLGHSPHIPGDTVQAIFNDMHLYPSKSQVSEMLQCARQCGRRNGTSPFLTFGEFCVFAREMQKPKPPKRSHNHKTNARCTKRCEVFLGGSCNPTTWRTDIAIPELQKYGISFYNPQKSIWGPELVAEEHDAKQSASILLYVVDNQTRSVVGMIEVAYLVASKRCVVLVAYPHQPGQSIMGEKISYREYVDLVDAQTMLLALVRNEGVQVYPNLSSALQRTATLLQNYPIDEQLTQPLMKLREAFDACDHNTGDSLPLTEVATAYNRLTNKTLTTTDLYAYLAIEPNADLNAIRITFEQFCSLVAEVEECANDDSQCVEEARKGETHHYVYDIFLGGTTSETAWRDNIAIPLIRSRGLTYYNPAMSENHTADDTLSESNLSQWTEKVDGSRIALFMISKEAKSLTSMILAAHYIGKEHQVVLCVESFPEDECQLGSEQLSKQAVKDYNRGRVYLTDIAKRKSIPVFDNITQAVEYSLSACATHR